MDLSDIVKILEERPGMITPDRSILEAHFFHQWFLAVQRNEFCIECGRKFF